MEKIALTLLSMSRQQHISRDDFYPFKLAEEKPLSYISCTPRAYIIIVWA